MNYLRVGLSKKNLALIVIMLAIMLRFFRVFRVGPLYWFAFFLFRAGDWCTCQITGGHYLNVSSFEWASIFPFLSREGYHAAVLDYQALPGQLPPVTTVRHSFDGYC